tara:strand:- start:72 stop:314 length:243 start_codon:yes stop_codon:yes gene_type:complete
MLNNIYILLLAAIVAFSVYYLIKTAKLILNISGSNILNIFTFHFEMLFIFVFIISNFVILILSFGFMLYRAIKDKDQELQ